MLRAYVFIGILALATYGWAQYRGWSVFGSDAQEFKRQRAMGSFGNLFGRTGGTGGFSGHK